MRLIPRLPRRARGFSLVELMVAMAAGLIIIAAAVIFAAETMKSYTSYTMSAKLTQELRSAMNLVVRELRRAGHDSTAVSRVLTTTSASAFNDVDIDGSCITYEYDRQVGAAGPDATEVRGFRLKDGVLQLNAASDSIDCDDDEDWEDVTDPAVIQITKFEPVMVESTFCNQVAERDTDGDTVMDEWDMATGSVRTVSLCLQGTMAQGDSITRHVTDAVRIRAEELEFEFNVDDNTCEPAAVAPATPTALNTDCAAP